MRPWNALVLGLAISFGAVCAEEEYSFDLSDIEPKPWQFGGYVEFQPLLYGLNKDAVFYKLKSYDSDEGQFRDAYDLGALLDGSYRKDTTEFRAIVNADLKKTGLGWSEDATLYEGFVASSPNQ